MIDTNKKIQDHANKIVNEAIEECPGAKEIEGLDDFLKVLVALSLRQGFIYGVTTIKQTTEVLLKDIKPDEAKE